ncbi:unnamed protein product, partial [Staurois parvus]
LPPLLCLIHLGGGGSGAEEDREQTYLGAGGAALHPALIFIEELTGDTGGNYVYLPLTVRSPTHLCPAHRYLLKKQMPRLEEHCWSCSCARGRDTNGTKISTWLARRVGKAMSSLNSLIALAYSTLASSEGRSLIRRSVVLFTVGVFLALVLNLLQVQRNVTLFPEEVIATIFFFRVVGASLLRHCSCCCWPSLSLHRQPSWRTTQVQERMGQRHEMYSSFCWH